MVAVDVRTGDPLWRFAMAIGGVNSSALLYKDTLIAIHGRENVDSSVIGRMIAIKRGAAAASGAGPVERDPGEYEIWRNDLTAFTSSPVLVGNRVYATGHTGELSCIDADSGEVLWHEKLAPDQIHLKAYYLASDEIVTYPCDAGRLAQIEEEIRGDFAAMMALLDDPSGNVPTSRDEGFPMIDDVRVCRRCFFRELCGR